MSSSSMNVAHTPIAARPRPRPPKPPQLHDTARPDATEAGNRDSDAVRASVLETALELGFGSNSVVADWIFNNPLKEEDEEQEPPSLTHSEDSVSSPSNEDPHTPNLFPSSHQPKQQYNNNINGAGGLVTNFHLHQPNPYALTSDSSSLIPNYSSSSSGGAVPATLFHPPPPSIAPSRPTTPSKLKKKRSATRLDGGYESDGAVITANNNIVDGKRQKDKDKSREKKKKGKDKSKDGGEGEGAGVAFPTPPPPPPPLPTSTPLLPPPLPSSAQSFLTIKSEDEERRKLVKPSPKSKKGTKALSSTSSPADSIFMGYETDVVTPRKSGKGKRWRTKSSTGGEEKEKEKDPTKRSRGLFARLKSKGSTPDLEYKSNNGKGTFGSGGRSPKDMEVVSPSLTVGNKFVSNSDDTFVVGNPPPPPSSSSAKTMYEELGLGLDGDGLFSAPKEIPPFAISDAPSLPPLRFTSSSEPANSSSSIVPPVPPLPLGFSLGSTGTTTTASSPSAHSQSRTYLPQHSHTAPSTPLANGNSGAFSSPPSSFAMRQLSSNSLGRRNSATSTTVSSTTTTATTRPSTATSTTSTTRPSTATSTATTQAGRSSLASASNSSTSHSHPHSILKPVRSYESSEITVVSGLIVPPSPSSRTPSKRRMLPFLGGGGGGGGGGGNFGKGNGWRNSASSADSSLEKERAKEKKEKEKRKEKEKSKEKDKKKSKEEEKKPVISLPITRGAVVGTGVNDTMHAIAPPTPQVVITPSVSNVSTPSSGQSSFLVKSASVTRATSPVSPFLPTAKSISRPTTPVRPLRPLNPPNDVPFGGAARNQLSKQTSMSTLRVDTAATSLRSGRSSPISPMTRSPSATRLAGMSPISTSNPNVLAYYDMPPPSPPPVSPLPNIPPPPPSTLVPVSVTASPGLVSRPTSPAPPTSFNAPNPAAAALRARMQRRLSQQSNTGLTLSPAPTAAGPTISNPITPSATSGNGSGSGSGSGGVQRGKQSPFPINPLGSSNHGHGASAINGSAPMTSAKSGWEDDDEDVYGHSNGGIPQQRYIISNGQEEDEEIEELYEDVRGVLARFRESRVGHDSHVRAETEDWRNGSGVMENGHDAIAARRSGEFLRATTPTAMSSNHGSGVASSDIDGNLLNVAAADLGSRYDSFAISEYYGSGSGRRGSGGSMNMDVSGKEAEEYSHHGAEDQYEEDDASYYPDDEVSGPHGNRTSRRRRSTVYHEESGSEEGGGKNARSSRWSGSIYSRASFMDNEKSGRARERLMKGVEAMNERERVPPVPKLPESLIAELNMQSNANVGIADAGAVRKEGEYWVKRTVGVGARRVPAGAGNLKRV